MSVAAPSVKAVRADEVLLDREQERLVLGELDEPALGHRVEIPVQRDLNDEARRTPRLGQRCHPEEDPSSVLVLRDRLERFDVVEPERVHLCQTAPAEPRIRWVSGRPA